jgi:hypothetical protein
MAGLVTYGNNSKFRNEFRESLLSLPIEKWEYGRDQDVLNLLDEKYQYARLNIGEWMSFGRGKGIFLTLKGTQKVSGKYLPNYLEKLEKINSQ